MTVIAWSDVLWTPPAPWGTIEVSGNPPCLWCGVHLLGARDFGYGEHVSWWWADEVTGGLLCPGETLSWYGNHQPGSPDAATLQALDLTP